MSLAARSPGADEPRGVTFDLGTEDPGACFRLRLEERVGSGHDSVATWTTWFVSRSEQLR